MPKDPQVEMIQLKMDDLVEVIEEYQTALRREREEAEAEQPDNAVYLRRLNTAIGYIDGMHEQIDDKARELLVQATDISFTKNKSRNPDFI